MMSESDAERSRVTGGYLIERFIAQRTQVEGKEPSQNDLAQIFYPDKSTKTGRDYIARLRRGDRSLTTGELVELLHRWQEYYRDRDRSVPSLNPEESLILLQKLVQLTPTEKQQLDLPLELEAVMLQQALLNISLYQDQRDYETILSLYRSSIGLAFSQEVSPPFTELLQVHNYVDTLVGRSPLYLPADLPIAKRQELTQKAKREIDRILLKCGVGQFQFQVPHVNQQGQSAYIQQYLPPRFIQRLTQAVIENELLTDDFPVFIKTITIQKIGPFPLKVALDPQQPGLILGNLLPFAQIDPELSSQYANRVTVHFYMRLPQDYQSQLPTILEQLKSRDDNGWRIDFSLSSTGIGGTLSHIIKVINTVLLADNQSLKDKYFPIAHDVLINQEIVRSNMPSPVWSHSLVKLCRLKTLAHAMGKSQASGKLHLYEEFSFGDQVGRGDYCGFDLLLCSANAALQARLRAIRLTGTAPHVYLHALGHRIERLYLLREARSYVDSYPFSSFALESRLRTKLIDLVPDQRLAPNSSYSLFDAYLSIVETYLDEGAYRRSHDYLAQLGSILKPLSDSGLNWLRRFGNDNHATPTFEIFSGSLIIRFELCRAHYFYLVDRDVERGDRTFLPDYIPLDQDRKTFHKRLIDEAWDALNKAEEHLGIRLAKYFIINEVSQGMFNPHHHHLAKIYFLKAKLLIFSAGQVPIENPKSPHYLPTDRNVTGNSRDSEIAIHGGRLYLMEKARIYAASNGNEEQYACYTACQCWVYLMAAFSTVQNIDIQVGEHRLQLTRSTCLDWAERMRNHALVSYAETGQRCYYQIKENSGLSNALNPLFGNYRISPIPPISEMVAEPSPGQQELGGVLSLDMSLLSVERQWCGHSDVDQLSRKIYLFGTNSCYLLFARGLFHLCSDQFTAGANEFEQVIATPPTISLWQQKFSLASRLLNLSWATADDGGQVQPASDGRSYDVGRNFMSVRPLEEGIDCDVVAVRDLYPHRVTEIADLGRVFASASLVLQAYTAEPERLVTLGNRISWILEDLQSLKHCSRPVTQRTLHDQPRYNGHLTVYLEQCRDLLFHEYQQALQRRSPHLPVAEIHTYRDRLISQLFAALSGITSAT